MTDTPPPRRDKARIVLIAVLTVSLIFNALALGAALRLHQLRQGLTGGDAAALTLPREMRRDILSALADAPELKAGLARVQAARRAVVAAATATPFNPAEAEAAMTELRGEVTRLMEQGQAVILQDLTRRNAP
jgi:hypothetical protein